MEISEEQRAVYRYAKYIALSRATDKKVTVLTVSDVMAAFHYLKNHKDYFGKMIPSVIKQIPDGLVFPEDAKEVLEEFEKVESALSQKEPEVPPMHMTPRLAKIHKSLLQGESPPPFKRFVEEICKFYESQAPAPRAESQEMPQVSARPVAVQRDATAQGAGGVAQAILDASRKSKKLKEILGDMVIGQEQAVEMLGNSYRQSLIFPPTKGVRGIFTFMGPPGVGKTMLAKSLAEGLSQIEGQPYGLLVASMEMTLQQNGEDVVMDLFGVHSSYKSGKPGRLHDAINGGNGKKGNPRQVFLIDEVEKAPAKAIQSFLTLLEEGKIEDLHSRAVVDLSQCYVVFTTNLGQDVFASKNRAGILRGSGFTGDDLFDLLGKAKQREMSGVEGAPSALSPEFISRLRTGGAVLFNQLAGRDLLSLMDSVLSGKAGDKTPPIAFSRMAKDILLLGCLPDISPRRLVAECGRWRNRFLFEGVTEHERELERDRPQKFSIEVHADQKAEDWLKSQRKGHCLGLVAVDDDERMAKFLEGKLEGQVKLRRTDEPDEAEKIIVADGCDLLLLDLDLPAREKVMALHKRVRETRPDLPVLFFGEEERGRDVSQILTNGGARYFFPFVENADEVLAGDQVARFMDVVEEVLKEKVMAERIRTRRSLQFQSSSTYECEKSEAKVVVSLSSIRDSQVVSAPEEKGEIAPAEIPQVTFDDVYGLERAKERLRDAVLFLKEPQKLQSFGVKPPSGILLAGPSGTGKTHLARAVANAAGCVFYALSAGELESKWVGEGEGRIRKLFAAARKYAPSVIFIDEIDAIAGNRASLSGGGGGVQSVKMLNQLLVCMDGFSASPANILVLAATNRPESLDPAILRPGRFDDTVRVDLPLAKARAEMFSKKLAELNLEEGVKELLPRLVCRTGGMSPAQLDRIVREACYTAAKADRTKISLADLEGACQLVRFGATRTDLQVTDEEKRRTAWHEAGHAVVRMALFPEEKIDYLTIIPSESGAMGFMSWNRDENCHNLSFPVMKKMIQTSLAGREAEKMCPDGGEWSVNTGASSDLEQATQMAWGAVTLYGFSEKFGPMSLDGVDPSARPHFSAEIRVEVNRILTEEQEATRSLLDKQKAKLAKLANRLFDMQAMDGDSVLDVLKNAS